MARGAASFPLTRRGPTAPVAFARRSRQPISSIGIVMDDVGVVT
jgi:hypothetical protein